MQSSPTVTLIKKGQVLLEQHGVLNALHNAEWMLSGLIGCNRADLYLRAGAAVDQALIDRFEQQILRRCRREPLQYILGSAEFMSYQFQITHGIFIPRFETELLVERVEHHFQERGIHEQCAILDLCCGSGVIALSLLLRNRGLSAVGVDSNPEAVRIAGCNADYHGMSRRAVFETGDAAGYLARSTTGFDLIVSNPPYIPASEIEWLAPEVREFEPRESLCGGLDGLDFYREAIPLLSPRLTEQGIVAVEIGAEQGEAVSALMRAAGLEGVIVYKDYAHFDRVVIAHAG